MSRQLVAIFLGACSLIHPMFSVAAVQIYAHRGTRVYFPESSMSAYKFAVHMGADWLDADLHLTKDGQLVVIHDDTLSPDMIKRKDGHWVAPNVAISDLTLKQLQQYTLSSPRPDSELSRLFPLVRDTPNATVSTLNEVVSTMDEYVGYPVRWQLEIKTNPQAADLKGYATLTKKVVEFIQSHQMVDRVEVQAFDWRVLQLIHQLNPKIHTAALLDRYTVSLQREKSSLDGIWTAGLMPEDFNWNYARMAASLGATCLEPYEMDATEEMVKQAHALGLKVVTWHWAEQQGAWSDWRRTQELVTWGVDGLIVDDLTSAEAMLVQQGQTRQCNASLPAMRG